MATKFYWHATTSELPSGTLPSDEQSTLTPDANDFEGSRTTNRLMNTSVGVSQANLSNTSTGDSNAHNYYITRFVSPLIYQAKIDANTWTVEYGAKESNATANFPRSSTGVMYVNCYVWKPSTGTKVGTILDGNSNSDGEEATTSQTVINFTFAGAAVTGITPGDAVIVYEVWAQVTQGNTSTRTQDFYYDGTTENSTSNEAAFLSTPENLQFSATESNATLLYVGGALQNSTANTTQYWTLSGSNSGVTTTEANVQIPIRTAGTLSKLSVVLSANTCAGTTSFTVRKNGSDTSLVANATSTGANTWEDLTNTVSVSAGDKINLKTIHGDAVNTFSLRQISLLFVPTDPAITSQIMTSIAPSNTFATASTTQYMTIGGKTDLRGTEANMKMRQRQAGTYQYFAVYVSANARTTDTIFKVRKNGSDAGISVTYTSGQTGLKEDTSNSFTVASGDDVNFAVTTSTGTETITYEFVKIEFTDTIYYGMFYNGAPAGQTFNANTTYYISAGAHIGQNTTESVATRKIRASKLIAKDFFVYVSSNGITADSTLTVMLNNVATAITMTLTNAGTGLFSDTTHSIDIGSNDVIDYKLVVGATGTTISLTNIALYYTTGRIFYDFTHKYNIKNLVNKTFTHKYNIKNLVNKTFTHIYNILANLTAVFQTFTHKYNIKNLATKTYTHKWNIRNLVNKVFTHKLNIKNLINKIFTHIYSIKNLATSLFINKYHIRNLSSIIYTHRLNIKNLQNKTFTHRLNIKNLISRTFSHRFNILILVSKIFTHKLNIRNLVAETYSHFYNIINHVSQTYTHIYNILELGVSLVSNTFTHKLNIKNLTNQSFIHKLNIKNLSGQTFTHRYGIKKLINQIFIHSYNIHNLITQIFTQRYGIRNIINHTFTHRYGIRNLVNQTYTHFYNILEQQLNVVSKIFTHSYNVRNLTSRTFTHKLNIMNFVSQIFTHRYNILAIVLNIFTNIYNITQLTSNVFTHHYKIRNIVGQIFHHRYNIQSFSATRVRKLISWIKNQYSINDPAQPS